MHWHNQIRQILIVFLNIFTCTFSFPLYFDWTLGLEIITFMADIIETTLCTNVTMDFLCTSVLKFEILLEQLVYNIEMRIVK